jgi:hypothetical protein
MRIPVLLLLTAFLMVDGVRAQTMIEQAFRTKDLTSIENMFSPSMKLRLGDSLYSYISSIEGIDLLDDFLAERDSICLRFTTNGRGSMTYGVETGLLVGPMQREPGTSAILSGTMACIVKGRRDTTQVDLWFSEGKLIALNISNYPIATVFLDIWSGAK